MVYVNYENVTLKDAVYAAAIGDALGVPYEFKTRDTFECEDMIGYGTHGQPEGTWSDDTSMILATCKSLKDNDGEIDIEDIRGNFMDWLEYGKFTPYGEVFDIGNATFKALKTGKPGMGKYDNGNGSLMRIIPLAFTDCTDEEIAEVSAITHGHGISKEACIIFVNLVREALGGRDLSDVVRGLHAKAPFDRLSGIAELSRNEIRSSGYVVDTLEAAIWCVLASDNMKECLLKAVNLGEDTDTVAAVAGALGITRFSLEDVPAAWIDLLKNKEVIEECV